MKSITRETAFDLKPDGILVLRKKKLGGFIVWVAIGSVAIFAYLAWEIVLPNIASIISSPLIVALIIFMAFILFGTPAMIWYFVNSPPVFHTVDHVIGKETITGKIRLKSKLGKVEYFNFDEWNLNGDTSYTVYANLSDCRKMILSEGTVVHAQRTCDRLNAYLPDANKAKQAGTG